MASAHRACEDRLAMGHLQENDDNTNDNANKKVITIRNDGTFEEALSDEAIETTSTKTTPIQCFVHIVKGYIGPGCLSLPWAFSQLGIPGGCLACVAMACWTSYNCWMIVELKRAMVLDYAASESSIMQRPHAAITYAHVSGWLCGKWAEQFTTFCICVQQLAICTVFLSFVATNVAAVLEAVWAIRLTQETTLSLVFPIVMGLSLLPNLKSLTPIITTATLLLLLALISLLVLGGVEWEHRSSDVISIQWGTSPLALCAILYSYEGICLIIPVESSMAEPWKFKRVFTAAMIVTAVTFLFVGAFSATVFGPVTNGSITAFLLERYALNSSIRNVLLAMNLAVSCSVILTYPLQLYPCLEAELPSCLVCLRGRVRRGYCQWLSYWHHHRQMVPHSEDDDDNIHIHDEHDESGETVTVEIVPDGVCVESGGDGLLRDQRTHGHDHQQHDSRASEDVTTFCRLSSWVTTQTWFRRILLVLFTYLVAWLIPNVESLISLAGAVAGSSTALLIPLPCNMRHCIVGQLLWFRRMDTMSLMILLRYESLPIKHSPAAYCYYAY